jgi:hypothetical protein
MEMPLTISRPAPRTLPSLEHLVLQPQDLPGYRLLFTERDHVTNEALAARAPNPETYLARLQAFGRIDGYAARFAPAQRPCAPSMPIVVDSSVALFAKGTGALQALTDEECNRSAARTARLFPRNIADNTECVYEIYQEDGVECALYRVDFRVQNVLGSVGAVWRRPRGGPLDVLEIAERQAQRIREALGLRQEPAAL